MVTDVHIPHVQPILCKGHFFAAVVASDDVLHPVVNIVFYTCHMDMTFSVDDTKSLVSSFIRRYDFGPGYHYANAMFGRHAYRLSNSCSDSPWRSLSSALYSFPVGPYEIPTDFHAAVSAESTNTSQFLIEEIVSASTKYYKGFSREELVGMDVSPVVLSAFGGDTVDDDLVIAFKSLLGPQGTLPSGSQDTICNSDSSITNSQGAINIPCVVGDDVDALDQEFSSALVQARSTSARTRVFGKGFRPPSFVLHHYVTVKDFAIYVSADMAKMGVPGPAFFPSQGGFDTDIRNVTLFWIDQAMTMARSYTVLVKDKSFFQPSYSIVASLPFINQESYSKDIIFTCAPCYSYLSC